MQYELQIPVLQDVTMEKKIILLVITACCSLLLLVGSVTQLFLTFPNYY